MQGGGVVNSKVHSVVQTAVFAAMIFVLTAVLHIPAPSGYVHLGDALIYLSSLLLGSPWALLAAAVGEGLADLAGGFASYIPATVVIKALMALIFVRARGDKLLTKKSALMTVFAGIVNVGGYFAADFVISRAYAFADVFGNAVQSIASAVIFVILAAALDRAHIMDRMKR